MAANFQHAVSLYSFDQRSKSIFITIPEMCNMAQ